MSKVQVRCRKSIELRGTYPVVWLAVTIGSILLGGCAAVQPVPGRKGIPPEAIIHFDFESGKLQGWRVVEGSFKRIPTNSKRMHFNQQGRWFIGTAEEKKGGFSDAQVGILRSPTFTLNMDYMSLLVGGGGNPNTYVALKRAKDDAILHRAVGRYTETMERVVWDVASHPALHGRGSPSCQGTETSPLAGSQRMVGNTV